MSLRNLIDIYEAQRRETIIDYLLTHQNPYQRTQRIMMSALGISQATLVKYLAGFKGEGLVLEKPFGTAVVYEIPYDIAIARGLADKYEIFDLDKYLSAKNQPSSREWAGRVFNFGDVVYIHATHKDGFKIGIPIRDKDKKELVEAVALGLNIEAIFTAIVNYFAQR